MFREVSPFVGRPGILKDDYRLEVVENIRNNLFEQQPPAAIAKIFTVQSVHC